MKEIELITDRLKLRLIEILDLESIHILHSLPETDEFNTLGIPSNIEETRSIVNSWIEENRLKEIKNYTFAIESKGGKEFMGLFGLKLGSEKFKRGEVWYKIHPDFWNQGFATESLKEVIDFGFTTLKLHRIEAGCAVANIGSIKVLEKAGMIREGIGRQLLPLKSGWSDNFQYSKLETEE
ncbi:Protein N-acetyltransferase, RimJ/RimL family [Algoriphagus locisalis]|uniref:Protein N-acetyltransferase, RimJ/RimL family n=1 Tax=Algoriphagus locisalis TaxID=305507 RepID=A0A1I7BT75_9BACT|nr:GNAT family N-acetyltransferase [Algoriphagus locisalis]SFT90398.1 Protein N-acetyltransferase, RimJ/RimL family [Algoriphagus locisalis]